MIINPLTASMYVTSIGHKLGVEVLNELGDVRNTKTQKILRRDAAENIAFINNVSIAGSFPWLLLHPFGMPYSLWYSSMTTMNAIRYALHDKTRVENGEFDSHE